MSRRRTIKYGIDTESGYAVSQVGDEVAFSVVDYDQIDVSVPGWSEKPLPQHLEKTKLWQVAGRIGPIRWMKNVPLSMKNVHRQFWGLKPLPAW